MSEAANTSPRRLRPAARPMKLAATATVLGSAETSDGIGVDLLSDGAVFINGVHPLLAAGTDEAVGWLLIHHAPLFHSREASRLAGSSRQAVDAHDRFGGKARGHFSAITGRSLDATEAR